MKPDLAPWWLEWVWKYALNTALDNEKELGKQHGFRSKEFCICVKLHKPCLPGHCLAEIKSKVSAHGPAPGPHSNSGFE